jgi:hypothetical protein
VPGDIRDVFFQQNAVTYTGQIIVNEEPVNVGKILSSDGTDCTIVLNTEIMGIPALFTLMGPISMDGSMCDFAGTETVIMTGLGPLNATINSGSATLSADGQTLGISNIDATVQDPIGDIMINAFECTCDSVDTL